MMGGDDSYKVLPYIDLNVIKNNPKLFIGYSDIISWMSFFAKAGIRAYYGSNLLTPIAKLVPMGTIAEIDCSCITFEIMKSGAAE